MNKISYILVLLFVSAQALCAQTTRTITGRVVDVNNTPLIGATISAQGDKSGTVTDLESNYTIEVPTGTTALVVSYLGYKPQTVGVARKQQEQQIWHIPISGIGMEHGKRNIHERLAVDRPFETTPVVGKEWKPSHLTLRCDGHHDSPPLP